jgi:hypothetical protein
MLAVLLIFILIGRKLVSNKREAYPIERYAPAPPVFEGDAAIEDIKLETKIAKANLELEKVQFARARQRRQNRWEEAQLRKSIFPEKPPLLLPEIVPPRVREKRPVDPEVLAKRAFDTGLKKANKHLLYLEEAKSTYRKVPEISALIGVSKEKLIKSLDDLNEAERVRIIKRTIE